MTLTAYVVSEPHSDEGLFIYDGTVLLKRITNTKGWSDINFDLTQGIHYIKVVYRQHGYVGGGIPGEARIRNVTITNTTNIPLSCSPCGTGSFLLDGQCKTCPENTYSSEIGSKSCVKCKDDEYSLEGSSRCTARPPCTASDYSSEYTQCKSGKQTVSTKLTSTLCNPSHPQSVSVVPSAAVDCSTCPYPLTKDSSGSCVGCPAGTVLKGDKCISVDEGRFSQPIRVITPTILEDTIDTSCISVTGDCPRSGGWRTHNNSYIFTFPSHQFSTQPLFSSSLDLHLPQTHYPGKLHGILSFILSMTLSPTQKLRLSVDDYVHREWNSTMNGKPINDSVNVVLGESKVSFTVIHEGGTTQSAGKDIVTLSSLLFHMFAPSASYDAIRFYDHPTAFPTFISTSLSSHPCPPGSTVSASRSSCDPCSPGTFSSSFGSKTCITCPKGSIAPGYGSVSCLSCPVGTTPDKTQSVCQNKDGCVVSGENGTQPIKLGDMKHIEYIDSFGTKIVMNPCNKTFLHPTCTMGKDDSSFACSVAPNGDITSFGRIVGLSPISNSDRSKSGVSILFSGGDESFDKKGVKELNSLRVDLFCDVESIKNGVNKPVQLQRASDSLLSTYSSSNINQKPTLRRSKHWPTSHSHNPNTTLSTSIHPNTAQHLTGKSIHACPVCAYPQDYLITTSECNTTTHTVTKIQQVRPGLICRSESSIEQTLQVACGKEAVITKGVFQYFAITVVVLFVFVIVILSIVIVVLARKYRKVKRRNRQLTQAKFTALAMEDNESEEHDDGVGFVATTEEQN
ncbi:hypothetical protein BLNAU_12306 [Blattamonas nauphoetae]|uniref:Tyrosine-protein kinase ephrin type A/B receptor-like domain-containing protein n=1 Tax=Blattamonas nauphoetae TaxID=2049346 RepID=A0ABQ9XJP6_9EUKA|nr:hypothetical protein BLNAU_12306 [Blattamonas nauphoetae]